MLEGFLSLHVLNYENLGVAYCALCQSECRKETVTFLRDMQIKSAHVLILIDKFTFVTKLEKGQCF